jgi:hypothetical protein
MVEIEHIQGERMAHDASNPGTAFEPLDANVRGILFAGIALGGVSLAAMLGMIGLFDHFSSRLGGASSAAVQLSPDRFPTPRQPRLEGLGSPAVEMQQRVEASHAGYGWVDHERQIVHVPIEEATKLIRGKLRSSVPPPASEKQSPAEKRLQSERTHPPGPSSSGRIVGSEE